MKGLKDKILRIIGHKKEVEDTKSLGTGQKDMGMYKRIADVCEDLMQAVEQEGNDYMFIKPEPDTKSCYPFIIEVLLEYCKVFQYNIDQLEIRRVKILLDELYVRYCETEGTIANDSSGIGGAIKELLQTIPMFDLDTWKMAAANDQGLYYRFLAMSDKLYTLKCNYELKEIQAIPLPRRRTAMLASFSHSTTRSSTAVSSSFESMRNKHVKGSHSWTTICNAGVQTSIELQYNIDHAKSQVKCMDLSADSKLLATGTEYGIHLYDTETGSERSSFISKENVDSLCFSTDGKCMAAITSDARLIVLDITTKKITLEANATKKITLESNTTKNSVHCCDFDFRLLACGTKVGTVDIWNLAKGKPVAKLSRNRNEPIDTLAVCIDRQLLAAAQKDVVLLWDIPQGRFIRQYAEHTNNIHSLAFSHDRKLLASAAWDSSINLWDPTSTSRISTCTATHAICSVGFSPSNGFIAAGTDNNQVFFWDLRATRIPYALLEAHTSSVDRLSFCNEGGLLATSGGSAVRVWKGFW